MARVSRKGAILEAKVPEVVPEKVYNAAAYIRLSAEGDDAQKNQDSMATQQYILEKFVEMQPDMRLVGVFCDNGETGTDFERPGFEQMMNEVQCRNVNCIVVKDLSRLGRNYIEVGYYLEKVFPCLQVRFVAINDQYDSLSDNGKNEMLISLKNLMNDLYAKDISKKINSTFEEMRKNGQFTSGLPPFGYQISSEDKHKLEIDPEMAPVVREIFQWRLEGNGLAQIVRRLNNRGIPSPGMYLYMKGYKKKKPSASLWHGESIRYLMRNPVYAGHMAQGRIKQSLCDGISQKKVPREEWIVVKHTHEAIIDQETFDKVQEIGKQRYEESYSRRGKYNAPENVFKGLLVCADCKKTMIRHKKSCYLGKMNYAFICRTYAVNLGGQGCTIKNVGETELMECVLKALQIQSELAIELEELLERLQSQTKYQKKCQEVESSIRQVQREMKRNTEAEFVAKKKQYEKEAYEMKHMIDTLQNEKKLLVNVFSSKNEWITILKCYKDEKVITREMALELIKSIEVSGYNKIEIVWNFQDEFVRLAREAAKVMDGE